MPKNWGKPFFIIYDDYILGNESEEFIIIGIISSV